MVKFELKDLDESLFSQKMRDVFKSLVDVYVSYPQKDTKDGFLKSIPSNYGYVFFWFGFLNEEALTKYYKDYVSKGKLREIEEARKKRLRECEEAGIKEWEGYFGLKDYIYDDLFPIVYDHSDVIGEGFAEVYLATLFDVDFEKVSIDKVIPVLKGQAKKLEKLNDFADKVFKRQIEGVEDIEINYETIKFVDSKASEEEIGALIFEDENYKHIFRREGWEICLRINFD